MIPKIHGSTHLQVSASYVLKLCPETGAGSGMWSVPVWPGTETDNTDTSTTITTIVTAKNANRNF